MRKIIVLATAASLAIATPAHADASAELKMLVDTYWAEVLKEQPIFASSLGIDTYAGEVGDYSLAGQDRQAASAAAFLKKLNAVDASQLNAPSKVEAGILRRSLNSIIEGNSYGQRAINFTTYSSWHQNFARMAENLPFKTKPDFISYNTRLKQYATVNDQSIEVANAAIRGKYTQPCETLSGFEATITGLITEDNRKSRFLHLMRAAVPRRSARQISRRWPSRRLRPSTPLSSLL